LDSEDRAAILLAEEKEGEEEEASLASSFCSQSIFASCVRSCKWFETAMLIPESSWSGIKHDT
jgi:hypothetical protein